MLEGIGDLTTIFRQGQRLLDQVLDIGWPPPGLARGILESPCKCCWNDWAPGIYFFAHRGLGSDVFDPLLSPFLIFSLWIVLPLYHGIWFIEAGTKVLASQLSLDCRARRSGWVGSTTLISSAFTALLNCAEVGRRNRILTNYRFLSHSLLSFTNSSAFFKCYQTVKCHNLRILQEDDFFRGNILSLIVSF